MFRVGNVNCRCRIIINLRKQILDANGNNYNGQTQLSLVVLSEFAIAESPELIFAVFEKHGSVVIPPREAWRPLSGGLEYNHYLAEPITVDEVVSRLIIEITRVRDRPENLWVNGFELRPSDASPNDWFDNIRAVLARDFETEAANETGVEKFTRGATECLLLSDSSTEPARLLLHRRMDIGSSPENL